MPRAVEPVTPAVSAEDTPTTPVPLSRPVTPDPDLHKPPPRRLIDIDWAQVTLTSDAEALALWERIAPTGADWDDKLQEIPATAARPLAIAVLRGGNFTCATPPSGPCAKPAYEVPAPAQAAGFGDPCLRRLLALWAISQLDSADLPAVRPALLAIAAIPPPESQLVEAAIHAIPEDEQDARLDALAAAWRAGQHDLVNAAVPALDDAHLVQAAGRHIAGAFHSLTAQTHRRVFLAAINDDALPARVRTAAISELVESDGVLAPDLAAALVTAVKTRDCTVAAAAARTLAQRGDRRFVPRRPRTRDIGRLMRAMCMVASYELLQSSDEPSLLAGYVPPRGLERITITYDPLSEVDSDGDGDPHTTHSGELLARDEVVLPEAEDLVRAMRHCTGAICVSDDREFRFVWTRSGGEPWLSRIELADRPPCTAAKP
jgi:hypothetical protein